MVDQGHKVLRTGFGQPDEARAPARELGPPVISHRRYARAIPAVRRLVATFKPEVVHAHFVSSYGLLAMLAASRVPLVQFAWGSDVLWFDTFSRPQRVMITKALRRAAAVVVDARDVESAVAALAPCTPITRVVFGPERSWTVAARKEEPRVLSPRQLKAFYNVELIVRAFAVVHAEFPQWELDVLTAGGDPTVLRRLAVDLGVDRSVTFWPKLDRAGLQDRFLRASVLCSVPSSDATSVALLEGLAAGVFPVVSDLPANRAWVEDGANGLIVPAGDLRALSVAVRRAIGDAGLRERAMSVNRPRVAAEAVWEIAVRQVDDLTGQVLGEDPRRRREAAQRRTS